MRGMGAPSRHHWRHFDVVTISVISVHVTLSWGTGQSNADQFTHLHSVIDKGTAWYTVLICVDKRPSALSWLLAVCQWPQSKTMWNRRSTIADLRRHLERHHGPFSSIAHYVKGFGTKLILVDPTENGDICNKSALCKFFSVFWTYGWLYICRPTYVHVGLPACVPM